jgi:hypothetical protein
MKIIEYLKRVKYSLRIAFALAVAAQAAPVDARMLTLTNSSLDAGTMVILGILSIPVAAFAAYATYLLASGKNHTTHS